MAQQRLREEQYETKLFKWLRQEFGLDSLPQHATEEVEPATVIANPAMRLIDKALESDKARAGRLRHQQAHWRGRRSRLAQAQRRQIKAAIDALETQIAGLQRARKSTDSHILAGELPPEIRLAALPAARRCLLDTLRLICYRAETLTATLLAPHLGKPAEVRALVKALFLSDATLRPDPAAGTLTVQLLHMATQAQDDAVAALCRQLNRSATLYPGTSLRLVYEILPPPSPLHDRRDHPFATFHCYRCRDLWFC